MADYGISRNSEGYADPTAAEGIKGRAKPGEIYEYRNRDVLIIKNQGGYSNVLTLTDHYRSGTNGIHAIEVAGRFTEPGMLSYVFNTTLGAFVERLSDADFSEVLSDVERALCISIQTETQPVAEEQPTKDEWAIVRETKAMHQEAEKENKTLRRKLELVRGMYDDLLTKFIDKFGSADCE